MNFRQRQGNQTVNVENVGIWRFGGGTFSVDGRCDETEQLCGKMGYAEDAGRG